MQDKFNEIKESQYASHVKEPLGKPYERGYNWPSKVQSGEHKFGLPSTGLENAKDMIYPATGGNGESEQVSEMYRKTHGNFAPGEQKNRNYNWKFDAKDHRFGYAEKRILNGAAQALHAERNEEQFPKTVIVKKVVEDQKAVASDILGKSKNLGQGQVPRGDDFVHGIKNVQGENPWNAARCIHGEPTAD
jgi:EF-hand domain-containing family member B